MRTEAPANHSGAAAAIRIGRNGQGTCISAPCSTSSSASILPATSAASATRSRNWSARMAMPSPASVRLTPAAVSTGSGSSVNDTGPAMRTSRPSRSEASVAMDSR